MNAIEKAAGGIKEDGLGNTCQLRRDKEKEHLQTFILQMISLKFEKNELSELYAQYKEG